MILFLFRTFFNIIPQLSQTQFRPFKVRASSRFKVQPRLQFKEFKVRQGAVLRSTRSKQAR